MLIRAYTSTFCGVPRSVVGCRRHMIICALGVVHWMYVLHMLEVANDSLQRARAPTLSHPRLEGEQCSSYKRPYVFNVAYTMPCTMYSPLSTV